MPRTQIKEAQEKYSLGEMASDIVDAAFASGESDDDARVAAKAAADQKVAEEEARMKAMMAWDYRVTRHTELEALQEDIC